MVVSMKNVICPHCKAMHNKNIVLGNSGLINYCGYEKYVTCDRCSKEFKCIMDVTIKYKTQKVD